MRASKQHNVELDALQRDLLVRHEEIRALADEVRLLSRQVAQHDRKNEALRAADRRFRTRHLGGLNREYEQLLQQYRVQRQYIDTAGRGLLALDLLVLLVLACQALF